MFIEEILSEVRDLPTTPKDLRKFGITMAVVLGLITGLTFYRGHGVFAVFLVLAIGFLGFGLLKPSLLKQVYFGWMTLAVTLGFFMTRVILTLLFYSAFVVIGFIVRLTNKDILDQQYDSQASTYWKPYEKDRDPKQRLERQF
jgi:hypothetical protein